MTYRWWHIPIRHAMLRRKRWHVVSWRRRPILVVMLLLLLILNGRRLRTVRFWVLVAVVVLITCRRIRRLKQLVERGCGSGRLRYTLTGHVVSLLGKHCTRWSRHAHHLRLGVCVPELAETVGLSIAVSVMLFRGWRMVSEIIAEATRGRWRIAILVGRSLFEIVSLGHVAVAGRLIAVLRSAVRRSTIAAAHVVIVVVVDRHLLLFTFGRFGRQATHGRPALMTAVLETGHIQRPVLVAIVHIAARLVFRVRSSHVRRRYRQQNVCQHPAATSRQRQRT